MGTSARGPRARCGGDPSARAAALMAGVPKWQFLSTWPPKGGRGSFQPPLMLSFAAALAALAVASIAASTTRRADLPWNIDEDTTVRDGTIDVNRSVHIHNGTLLIGEHDR